ncbi:PDZ domain-containing protein 2 [Halotydeus destructor]|nr:PDZ domain-containing protein 2 [Halotydeus destructor]
MSISSQGLSSGQQDGNNLETVAPDQQTTTCSDQNADSGKFKAVASMFAKKVISRSSPLVGNLYPTNTTSSSTLNLMGQLKAWTLDRKLKGKLRRLSSRSGLNSNNNQIKVDSVVNCVDDKDSIDCCSVQSKNSGEDSCFDESTSTTSNRSTPSPGTPGIPCPQSSEPPSSEAPQAASTMSLSPSSSTGSEADSQYNSDYGERDDLQKAIDCLTADQLARVNLLAVTLDKDDQGELGIYVTGKMDSDGSIGYVIADFEADGPAQRNGRLNKGDEVLMVNGNGLRGLNLDDALQFLRSRETSLRLIVARQCQVSVSSKNESLSVCSNSESLQSMSHSHSSLNATETVTTKPQIGALNTSLNNQRRRSQASPAPCEQQQAAAQPCLSQSVAGQRIRRASSSLEAEYEKDETISIASNSTNSSALMESGLFTVPRRPKSSARILLQTLTFYKGPGCRGLGFSIVGGADAENSCSNNVYIKTIYPNGQAAERLDELKQGDELLAVNGISTKGLTHSEVIALFKTVKCGEVIIQTSRKLSSIRKAFNRSNHKSCSTLDLLK